MSDTQSCTHKEYKTTFTPDGQLEPRITCAGKCGATMDATKFGFKYGSRDGVRGKIRNSSCLNCRANAVKIRDTKFQTSTLIRTSSLEHESARLEEALVEERSKNEKLQLVILKLSGELEEMKALLKALSNKVDLISNKS